MSKYQTGQRKILLDLFKNNQHKTFSVTEIQEKLTNNNISISAIYRNLSDMVQDGYLCKVSEQNRSGNLYQYIDPEHCVGVIHLKCKSCNATYHLDRNISQMIMAVAKDNFAFTVNGQAAYLYGICAECENKLTNN